MHRLYGALMPWISSLAIQVVNKLLLLLLLLLLLRLLLLTEFRMPLRLLRGSPGEERWGP
jgi:hypothetical protein